MKISLIASAAALALVASAAQAQAIDGGYLGANFAATTLDVPGKNPDIESYQVEGAALFNLGDYSALIDGAVTNVGGDVNDEVDYAFTAHLNRKLGGALVGGFAGFYATDGLNVWGVGAEGQFAVNDAVTLYGQAGYGNTDKAGDADLWAVRGEVRYFINENFKVQGTASYLKVQAAGPDADIWGLGVEGEYQFAGTPWSIRAGYDYGDSDDLDVKSHTFRIGGRYTFGGATLKAREAAGADLGSVRKLFTGVAGF